MECALHRTQTGQILEIQDSMRGEMQTSVIYFSASGSRFSEARDQRHVDGLGVSKLAAALFATALYPTVPTSLHITVLNALTYITQ